MVNIFDGKGDVKLEIYLPKEIRGWELPLTIQQEEARIESKFIILTSVGHPNGNGSFSHTNSMLLISLFFGIIAYWIGKLVS